LRERGDRSGAAQPRRVLKIALPIVVSNATVPLLGIVDTAVVGQLGDPVPIGAVGLGAIILSSVYWVFGFLRMGTVGLAAQALGARDGAEVAALLTRVLMIGVGAGLALIALQVPILAGALWLSPASAEVEALVRSYMTIRVFSAPAAIALRDHRLADRAGADGRGPGAATGAERLNIALSVWCWCWASISACRGRGLGHVPRGMGGAGAGPVALPSRPSACPAWRDWAAGLRPGEALADGGGERGYPDPLASADGGFTSFLFFAADFGDVTLAANQVLIQFVYLSPTRWTASPSPPRRWWARRSGARARGALRRAAVVTSIWGMIVSLRRSSGVFAGRGWRVHRPDDHRGNRAAGGTRLPAMDDRGAAGGGSLLDARRHLHRGHAHARHAQHDGGELRGLRARWCCCWCRSGAITGSGRR
jgi:MATE family multidrug resistance protein